MLQWRFIFGQLTDIDGLIRKCLNSVPQYRQAYPAARADVSAYLERMVSNGLPPNENSIWHKITHGQRRYYLTKQPNGVEEVRVKTGGGVFGKADRDLKILTTRNECEKIVRQLLVRWNENGSLAGWKTIWSVFDVGNYDVSERRIKIIQKIIQNNVTRESFHSNNIENDDIESTCDQSKNGDDFVIQYQDDGSFSRDIENNDSHTVQQSLLSNEDDRIQSPSHLRQTSSSIINDSTTSQTEDTNNIDITNTTSSKCTPTSLASSSSSKCKELNTTSCISLSGTNKENDVDREMSMVGQKTQESTNSPIPLQSSSNSIAHYEMPTLTQTPTTTATKKKRPRRVYATKTTPYPTRRRGQLTANQT